MTYTVRDICNKYGVHEQTVLAWIHSGELKAVNVGVAPGKKKPRWRITQAALGDDAKIKSDSELIRAIRPSLTTVGGRLICISSPYACKGWSYSQYRRNFGNESGAVLVWNSPSRTMNPALPQSIIDEAMAEDPAAARAEYLGEFRDDVATFLPREVVEAVVVKGRNELPPIYGREYMAFADLSGGRVDDAALAIAHVDSEEKVILDCLPRWASPFSPDAVVGEMVALLARYRCQDVTGDNYSAELHEAL